MTQGYKLINWAASVLVVGTLFSCTAESGYLHDPDDNVAGGNVVNLLKAPDVIAYSNGVALGDIALLSANVNGNLWYQDWDRPTNVTEEEIAKVLEEASKVRVGATNDIHIDWNNYWVQQVWTGTDTYVDGFGNNIGTGSSHMNRLLAYSNKKKVRNVITWWDEATGGPIYEEEIVDKDSWEDLYEHVNNFNNGDNSTVYIDDETGEKFYGTTLMTDMYADGIVDQFGYHNSTDSKNHFEYIILEIDGNYYVCFDFYATHPDGQDANKNMDVERDWVFNDWIVKISPAYLKGTTPSNPTPDPTDPTDPVDPEDPDPTPGEEVDTPAADYLTDHVETNLSIEKHADYLSTHLSIHVRANTDVEVFIPLKAEYYCATDDMEIVKKHEADFFVHGGPSKLTYDINGNEIALTVNFEKGGIKITTDGINQDVLDYLSGVTGDGLTFEIWNYVNLETGLDDNELMAILKDALNRSTITFLDSTPGLYVNAFNKDSNGDKWAWDCTVDINDLQKMSYKDSETGYFFNKSPYNELYFKK